MSCRPRYAREDESSSLIRLLLVLLPPFRTPRIQPCSLNCLLPRNHQDIDVILVAPKGSGTTVRSLFLEGRGINSSVAVYQDMSGKSKEKAIALGVAVGSGYMYDTTFKKEVYSDLTGERGVLMGAIQGLFQAQYEVLRAKGTSWGAVIWLNVFVSPFLSPLLLLPRPRLLH